MPPENWEATNESQRRAAAIPNAIPLECLRNEYRIREISRFTGGTIEELVDKLDIDKEAALQTIRQFNEARRTDRPFNPSKKDGCATIGIEPAKTNWANKLDEPPFEAYEITCGITFTYGGLKITPHSEVVAADTTTIPGLFAAGELVGGLYYHNYAGSVGLVAGAVFGRRAGCSAATFAATNTTMSSLK